MILLEQLYSFFIFFIIGIIISILFDIFRILRKSFKTPDFITYLEDIIFWVLTGLIVLYAIFKFNNGEIRSFIFVRIIVGILVYIFTISKYIVKYGAKILLFIKKILMYPIMKLVELFKKIYSIFDKILIRPFTRFLFNMKNKMSKISLKNVKYVIKKKDFKKMCRKR